MEATTPTSAVKVPRPDFLYWTLRKLVGTILIGHRVEVKGLENIPTGRAILAPNHTSNLDPPLVGTCLPLPLHFAAKSQMFKPVLGWFLKRGLTHPVKRQGGDPQAIRLFRALLESEQKIVMFPEGTRSRDGALQPFKSGVATLACWTQSPIVPVAIVGARAIWPPGKLLPHWKGDVRILIGKPLYPPTECDKNQILTLTQDLESAVKNLLLEGSK